MGGFSHRVGILDSNLNKISDQNTLPVKDIDSAERSSLNTVFGEKIIGIRKQNR